eukprot:COSAG01_NODE_39459_length_476_cov_0.795756_1_plen_133_part_00
MQAFAGGPLKHLTVLHFGFLPMQAQYFWLCEMLQQQGASPQWLDVVAASWHLKVQLPFCRIAHCPAGHCGMTVVHIILVVCGPLPAQIMGVPHWADGTHLVLGLSNCWPAGHWLPVQHIELHIFGGVLEQSG